MIIFCQQVSNRYLLCDLEDIKKEKKETWLSRNLFSVGLLLPIILHVINTKKILTTHRSMDKVDADNISIAGVTKSFM